MGMVDLPWKMRGLGTRCNYTIKHWKFLNQKVNLTLHAIFELIIRLYTLYLDRNSKKLVSNATNVSEYGAPSIHFSKIYKTELKTVVSHCQDCRNSKLCTHFQNFYPFSKTWKFIKLDSKMIYTRWVMKKRTSWSLIHLIK